MAQHNPYGGQIHNIEGSNYQLDVLPLVSGGAHHGLCYGATRDGGRRALIQVIQVHGQNLMRVRNKEMDEDDPRDLYRHVQPIVGGITYSLCWPLNNGAGGIVYLAAGSDQNLVAIKLFLLRGDPLNTNHLDLVQQATYARTIWS